MRKLTSFSITVLQEGQNLDFLAIFGLKFLEETSKIGAYGIITFLNTIYITYDPLYDI